MKNVNNFQIAKVQPRGVAQHFLTFCQFQPGVGYKSVAYKKKLITKKTNSTMSKNHSLPKAHFPAV